MKPKGHSKKAVAIARDFYYTGMTIKEIGMKYNIHPHYATELAKRFTIDKLRGEPKDQPDDDSVVLIDKKHMMAAIEALNDYGIKYTIPTNYRLQVEIESKINFD